MKFSTLNVTFSSLYVGPLD